MPDYRGCFLHGVQSGQSVGEMVENSVKSHNHTQPTHTHSFSGQLVPTALTGTADGQNYSSSVNLTDSGILWTTNYYDATGVTNGSGPIRSGHISSNITTKTASSSSVSGSAKGTVSGTANASSVSGSLKNGTVTGIIGAGGGILRIILGALRQPQITSMCVVLSVQNHKPICVE